MNKNIQIFLEIIPFIGKILCYFDIHRLYETVKNFATGMPSTGYACYRCGDKWDWDGNPRPKDGTGH